ncbi:MAG TPA: hypothetical protein VGS19_02210 [Streptosporangiaceae bacterium]|nr:hypothetical protein [Streptosporangiaceae bacterium]
MPQLIEYFAIVGDGETAQEPSGLARRTFTPEGRLDETLSRDLLWKRSSAIYDWERGEEMGTDLVEISEEEAMRLVERFKEKWEQEG